MREIYCYEVGVLLNPTDEEFDQYNVNNPDLPYGFYNEDEGLFLDQDLASRIQNVKDYVKNGVEGTYGVVAFWGAVSENDELFHKVLKEELEDGLESYTFFKNLNEVVFSVAKIDGELKEGFLEQALKDLSKEAGIAALLDVADMAASDLPGVNKQQGLER